MYNTEASKETFHRWHENLRGKLSRLKLLSELDQEGDHRLTDCRTSLPSAGEGRLSREELDEREKVVVTELRGDSTFERFW